MDTFFRIPTSNLHRLTDEVAKINRKATKLGAKPVILHYHGTEAVERKSPGGQPYKIEYTLVSATGDAPKLAGWQLVAAVERVASGEKLVRTVPGVHCPEGFRTRDNSCDHCGTKRFRREVFVLRHDDGRHVQVGRQCVSDFLGGQSPDSLLGAAACLWAWEKVAEEAEAIGWGGSAEVLVDTEAVLVTAALVIRRIGWQPKAGANEGRTPTAVHVQRLLWPAYGDRAEHQRNEFIKHHDLYLNDADKATGAAALAWAKQLPADVPDSYMYNLGVIARNPHVRDRDLGLAVSIVAAYQREQGRLAEAERKAKARPSDHVGTVGERRVFEGLTVTDVRTFEGDYGLTTLVSFEDADGNRIKWWASGEIEWAERGKTVTVKATVKKHDVYNGAAVTYVNRAVVQ